MAEKPSLIYPPKLQKIQQCYYGAKLGKLPADLHCDWITFGIFIGSEVDTQLRGYAVGWLLSHVATQLRSYAATKLGSATQPT